MTGDLLHGRKGICRHCRAQIVLLNSGFLARHNDTRLGFPLWPATPTKCLGSLTRPSSTDGNKDGAP